MNTLHILLMLSWALIVVSIVMSIRFIRFQHGQYTEHVQDLIHIERQSCAKFLEKIALDEERDTEPSSYLIHSLFGAAGDIRAGAHIEPAPKFNFEDQYCLCNSVDECDLYGCEKVCRRMLVGGFVPPNDPTTWR